MGKQYIVDGNLNHNNHQYKSGDPIVLEEAEAQSLLTIGRVKEPEAPAQPQADGFPQREQQPVQQPQAPAPSQPAQAQPQQAAPAQPQAKPASGQPSPEDIARTAAEVQ